MTFRDLKPVGKLQVCPGRTYYVGALTYRRLTVYECGHKHGSRIDAKECVEATQHCDVGSLMAEELQECCDRVLSSKRALIGRIGL